jgi:hypothetical protein
MDGNESNSECLGQSGWLIKLGCLGCLDAENHIDGNARRSVMPLELHRYLADPQRSDFQKLEILVPGSSITMIWMAYRLLVPIA